MMQEYMVQYYIDYDKSTLAMAPRSEVNWAIHYVADKTNCGLVRIWEEDGWYFFDAGKYVFAVDDKLAKKF